MSATIISMSERRPPQSASSLDPDTAYLARLFATPAYKALPFVTLKEPHERSGCFDEAVSWWNDVPTGDEVADHKRGIAYAKAAIEAIRADQCRTERGLQLTFEHIFRDAVRRREKGGKGSRSLSSAASAFLSEICSVVYAEAVQS